MPSTLHHFCNLHINKAETLHSLLVQRDPIQSPVFFEHVQLYTYDDTHDHKSCVLVLKDRRETIEGYLAEARSGNGKVIGDRVAVKGGAIPQYSPKHPVNQSAVINSEWPYNSDVTRSLVINTVFSTCKNVSRSIFINNPDLYNLRKCLNSYVEDARGNFSCCILEDAYSRSADVYNSFIHQGTANDCKVSTSTVDSWAYVGPGADIYNCKIRTKTVVVESGLSTCTANNSQIGRVKEGYNLTIVDSTIQDVRKLSTCRPKRATVCCHFETELYNIPLSDGVFCGTGEHSLDNTIPGQIPGERPGVTKVAEAENRADPDKLDGSSDDDVPTPTEEEEHPGNMAEQTTGEDLMQVDSGPIAGDLMMGVLQSSTNATEQQQESVEETDMPPPYSLHPPPGNTSTQSDTTATSSVLPIRSRRSQTHPRPDTVAGTQDCSLQ